MRRRAAVAQTAQDIAWLGSAAVGRYSWAWSDRTPSVARGLHDAAVASVGAFVLAKLDPLTFERLRNPRRGAVALGLLLTALFALRVYYGLSLELRTGDDVQIYLLGLKFFTTHRWPFFGPDVVHSDDQIAGPLQGLL